MDSQPIGPGTKHDDIASLLRARGIYPTAQRLKIAGLLFATHQHITAENLRNTLLEAGFRVSKATIYNTLSRFVKAGLLGEVIADNKHVFYDSNTSHHQHFYNFDTGELIDMDRSLPLSFGDKDLPEGTSLDSIDIIVRVRSNTR